MRNNRLMPETSRTTRIVDVLGEPYYTEPIELQDDDEGEVVATLVSRDAAAPSTRAVLHVHGFADYFFQRPMADYWVGRGYDFYAIDLRQHGRSIRHDHVVISAHSTGGLITALWAHDRQPDIDGLVLNSPWLDLQGSLLMRTAGTKAIDQIGLRRPYLTIPRDVSGFYARSLHRDHDGEW